MLRFVFILCAGVFLASCASNGDVVRAEPVAVQNLLAQNRGRPFECVNYDKASDSCEAISQVRLRRDKISFSTDFLLVGPVGETVRATIVSDFKLDNGGYCGNLAKSRLRVEGNLTQSEQRAFRDIFGVVSSATGEFCDRYFVDEFGRNFTLTFGADGEARRGSLAFVTYHRAKKRLRL